MRVSDLVTNAELRLTLRSGDTARLDRDIRGCAQAEMMDPSRFLQPGELVLTTGMGLHFQDPRTWDAYVERMARVGIAGIAFGIGRIHQAVPDGLITACDRQDIPLLESPQELPLLQLSRHIWQQLAAERYAVARTGWELADECARLATEGASLTAVLERVAAAIDAHVTLRDPHHHALAAAGIARHGTKTTLRLPGGPDARFELEVEGVEAGRLLQPVLGPVAALLAMQLSYTLASRSPLHSRSVAQLVDALGAPDSAAEVLEGCAADAGFDPASPWSVVLVERDRDASHASLRLASWRLRGRLESHFGFVRFAEDAAHTTLLLQRPTPAANLGALAVAALEGTHVQALHASELTLSELPLVLQIARREPWAVGVRPIPTLDLVAVATGLPAPGLASLAERMLAPLDAADASGELRRTLDAFLRFSGRTSAVCDALFIHRNTLAYRMRRIEQLLAVDLGDGEARATLMLASRIRSS